MGPDWRAELVPACGGLAWRVPEGGLLKVVDIEGGQTGDLFAVAADDLTDGQSSGRSFDYGATIRLTTGSVLYSRRSRPLLRIVEDEIGTHDFLYAPCSQEMFELQYGATGPRPNCFTNLTTALGRFGVPPQTVTIAFNVFLHVAVDERGGLSILPPVSTVPGRGVTFRAEREVLVAVTACSTANCNGGVLRPLQVRTAAAPPEAQETQEGTTAAR